MVGKSVLLLFLTLTPTCQGEAVWENTESTTNLWGAIFEKDEELGKRKLLPLAFGTNGEIFHERSEDGRGGLWWAWEYQNTLALATHLTFDIDIESEEKKDANGSPPVAMCDDADDCDKEALIEKARELVPSLKESFLKYLTDMENMRKQREEEMKKRLEKDDDDDDDDDDDERGSVDPKEKRLKIPTPKEDADDEDDEDDDEFGLGDRTMKDVKENARKQAEVKKKRDDEARKEREKREAEEKKEREAREAEEKKKAEERAAEEKKKAEEREKENEAQRKEREKREAEEKKERAKREAEEKKEREKREAKEKKEREKREAEEKKEREKREKERKEREKKEKKEKKRRAMEDDDDDLGGPIIADHDDEL